MNKYQNPVPIFHGDISYRIPSNSAEQFMIHIKKAKNDPNKEGSAMKLHDR